MFFFFGFAKKYLCCSFSQNTNSMLTGHHDTIPPNLGGPQNAYTSFQPGKPISKTAARQPITGRDSDAAAATSGSSSSSGGESGKKNRSDFEQILSQTKELQHQQQQQQQQDQQDVVINHSIEETNPTSGRIAIQRPFKVTLDDELFKGSPDSFFGVESVENVTQRIIELNESRTRGESGASVDPGKLMGLVWEKSSSSKPGESRSTSDGVSDLKPASAADSSPIGDPVPLNHKMSGSVSHQDPQGASPEESGGTNYESRFKMWPTARDHAGIPRTDSSDLLDDYPIERAVRKSVCEDGNDASDGEDSAANTACGRANDATSPLKRCALEADDKASKKDDAYYDSLATFSLARNSPVTVIESKTDS